MPRALKRPLSIHGPTSREGRLAEALRTYTHVPVLVIDEVGDP